MEKENVADKVAEATKNLLDDSEKFVVIGLTGRTGSGCTTSANILSSENIKLPDSGDSHYEGNEKRKYRIIKKFLEKQWRPFVVLQVRSVITRCILDLNFAEFKNFVSQAIEIPLVEVGVQVDEFKANYDEAFLKAKSMHDMPENSSDEIAKKKEAAYEFYFKYLPIFSDKIKSILSKLSPAAYTAIYQLAGDNIRASGKVNSKSFNPSKLFSFANLINKVIKSARHYFGKDKKSCFIVIDAIRNPYEATFLRDRYAGFYLVSINTKNENRLKHLKESHKFTDLQIKALDDKEYPEKLVGYQKYCSQNIQKCIEIADVHINNPKHSDFATSELASQLAWYVALMLHPGLVMPTSIESCMQIAYGVKINSGCISRQVGAVVTDSSYATKAVGWNNTAQGQVPCLLRSAENLLDGSDSFAYSFYEKNDRIFREHLVSKYVEIRPKAEKNGRNLAFCFKDMQNSIEGEKNQVHTRSLHAEENAFLQISKHGGQMLKGGVLFTTASPCELCAKKAYQLGISKIVYIDPYPGIATTHILNVGSGSPELMLFRGAVGSAFHKLYQPLMPYKDELEMLFNIPKKENKKELEINRLKRENEMLKEKLASFEKNDSKTEHGGAVSDG
ncbi:hypothetical protein [Vogesella sp. EB]|uniref:hypothetical protein n=1 Tax=Vogesella sp. EB TaxID=1526735 RepID=UPI0009E5272B|nr:hypothetical protein [Vogesella sp. EB]